MRPILVVITLCLHLTGCAADSDSATAPLGQSAEREPGLIRLTEREEQRLGLTTAVAQTRAVPLEVALAAVVEANTYLTTPVMSLVPGRVEEVLFRVGDPVTKGQVLARLRSDVVGQIEAELLKQSLELEAERIQLHVQLELAQKVFDRRKLLYEEKIGSRADFEVAQSELQKTRGALEALEAKRQALIAATREHLSLFGIPVDETDRVLRTRAVKHVFDVRSPRTGIVTARDVDPGEMIDASKELFVVTDIASVWVTAQVFERDVRAMKSGLPVKVSVESFPGAVFHGTLDFVGTTVDPQTRTLPVRATVANPQLRLKPQMFARMTVRTATVRALFVPNPSVQKIGETNIVYVVTGKNEYMERKVKVGPTIDAYTEILEGLRAGERVVVNGSLQLLGQELQRLNK